MKLISLVSLLPVNTAVCERGFSMMNRIKSEGRSRMGSTMLNSLMCISIDRPSLESFDAQPAVNQWSSEVHRRPGYRKPSKDVSIDSSTCFSSEYEFSSDMKALMTYLILTSASTMRMKSYRQLIVHMYILLNTVTQYKAHMHIHT